MKSLKTDWTGQCVSPYEENFTVDAKDQITGENEQFCLTYKTKIKSTHNCQSLHFNLKID